MKCVHSSDKCIRECGKTTTLTQTAAPTTTTTTKTTYTTKTTNSTERSSSSNTYNNKQQATTTTIENQQYSNNDRTTTTNRSLQSWSYFPEINLSVLLFLFLFFFLFQFSFAVVFSVYLFLCSPRNRLPRAIHHNFWRNGRERVLQGRASAFCNDSSGSRSKVSALHFSLQYIALHIIFHAHANTHFYIHTYMHTYKHAYAIHKSHVNFFLYTTLPNRKLVAFSQSVYDQCALIWPDHVSRCCIIPQGERFFMEIGSNTLLFSSNSFSSSLSSPS